MSLVKMLYSGEDVVIPIFDHWLRRYLGENLPPSEWRNRYLKLAAARNIKLGYYALAVAVLLIGCCCGCFGKSPMIWLLAELGLFVSLVVFGLMCGKFFFAEWFFYRDYQQLKELIPGKDLCRLRVEEVHQLAQEKLRALLARSISVLETDPSLNNQEASLLCDDYRIKKGVLCRFGFWNPLCDEQKSGFPAVIGIPITGVETVPIPEG